MRRSTTGPKQKSYRKLKRDFYAEPIAVGGGLTLAMTVIFTVRWLLLPPVPIRFSPMSPKC